MLKKKLEEKGYKYYFGDSKSNDSIQYYSVLDMINKNIGKLVINPVRQENYSTIIGICEEEGINGIDLYSHCDSDYNKIATITYDFKRSVKISC